MAASTTPTPFAVRCAEHGLVYLTEAEYRVQMDNPDDCWRCPTCRQVANWDDDNYEDRIESYTWEEE